MNVLLTNDDGINSPGLRALYAILRERGHAVLAAAPVRQQSAMSRGLTVFEPLRIQKITDGDFQGYGVYGTPADCAKLAMGELMPATPDLLISGINEGSNIGPDIFYSGTVGAAAEGALAQIPSFAFSCDSHEELPEAIALARHAIDLTEKILKEAPLPGRVINVNYPALPLAQMRRIAICPQAVNGWRNDYGRRKDPRGWPYWWLEGGLDKESMPPGSDIDLLKKGHITVTPLRFDCNDPDALAAMRQAGL